MRFVWEEDDIVNMLGQVVVHKDTSGEHWLIGYVAEHEIGDDRRYQLISLRDGMVQPPKTAAEMAHALNCGQKRPLHLQRTMVETLIKDKTT